MLKTSRYFTFALSVAAVLALAACEDKNTETKIDAPELNNSFAFGSETSKIKSVVYSPEEDGRFTKFYFSPTEGLTDEESMVLYDDAIVITASSADGTIDFSEAGNELEYGDFSISSATAASFSKLFVSLKLDSPTEVTLSIDAEKEDGRTLKCEYSGRCTRWPEEETAADVVLDAVIMAKCLGKMETKSEQGEDIYNYYILLTDADYTLNKSDLTINEAGTVLCLDLYSVMVDPPHKLVIPTGEFNLSDKGIDKSYGIKYSCVGLYNDSGVQTSLLELDGPVTIERDGGNLHITAYGIDEKLKRVKLEYSGEDFYSIDAGSNFSNPQIGKDVEFEGVEATALYYGNLFDSATGMMLINIFDENYDIKGKDGYCVSLVVFSDLFGNPKNARLIPGKYTMSKGLEHGTWLPAMEINYYGIPMVMGSYAHYLDARGEKATEKYSYGTEGEIEIIELADNAGFTVNYDLFSNDGYRIRGSYTGKIPVIDNSDDKGDDDGTSTLEKDYDMDLSMWDCAYVAPLNRIWVGGMGYYDIDGEALKNIKPTYPAPFGLQYVYIGLKGDDGEGDRVLLELLVNDDAETYITPGTYPCTEDRFPEHFVPGHMMRGIMLEGDFASSSFVHLNEKTHMDQHANFYGGEVTITKAEGGDNWFTFDIDGICVRKHHVRGSWTGPVYRYKGTVPVTEWPGAGTAQETVSARQVRSAAPVRELAPLADFSNGKFDIR